jgi:hypothetical protein
MRFSSPIKCLSQDRERYRLMGDNEWQTWFAWYPVWMQGCWVWLEDVEFNQPMKYNLPTYRLKNKMIHSELEKEKERK